MKWKQERKQKILKGEQKQTKDKTKIKKQIHEVVQLFQKQMVTHATEHKQEEMQVKTKEIIK